MKRINAGKLIGRVLVLCAGITLAGSVRADLITIAAWDFNTEATFLQPSTVGANVTLSNVSGGSSGSWSWVDLSEISVGNSSSGGSDDWSRFNSAAADGAIRSSNMSGGTSYPYGINENRYLEFSVQADPGYVLGLERIRINVGAADTSTGNRGFIFRYSFDGFDTHTEVGRVNNRRDSSVARFVGGRLDFADLVDDFSDLTGTVTFRFYPYVMTGNNRAVTFDNIELTGSVIPEPGSALLLGLGGLLLMLRRRLAG